MKIKKRIILFAQIFLILTLCLVINTSKFDIAAIPLYSVNNKGLTLNTAASWSNATVISDLYGWNNGDSHTPSVAVDGSGNLHVVWSDDTDGEWGSDREIMYANYTASGWSNAIAISDLYGWNNGGSWTPSVAVDSNNNLHVVWVDNTFGEWGTDYEIFYANYTASGWSNATVISDDSTGWNDGTSTWPSIAVDGSGNVHVVWWDETTSLSEWGSDREIMYAKYTASGWSNATVISDNSTGWNTDDSLMPSVAVDDSSNVHVVWEDYTDGYGEWGTDTEIMYAKYTASGWSDVICISDQYGWNDDDSLMPSVAADSSGNVHVVWEDDTNGEWGTDTEIMYAKYTASGWSNATCISDLYGWNNGDSSTSSVAVDSSGNVHVVWRDTTFGEWGGVWPDTEIMYANYTAAGGSNATCISDLYGWNNDSSIFPSIAADSSGNVHVVWSDDTDGEWGTDSEIMYAIMTERPTSNHPGDITTTILFSPAIYWQLYDETGRGQYRVWANDTNNNYFLLVNWTPWTNGTYIIVDIAMVGLGTFNYTIEYYDFYHQFGISDTVIVKIIAETPTSNHPDDMILSDLETETIDWILTDNIGEGQYRVWANDTNDNYYIWQDWNSWNNGFSLNVPINYTAPGTYNYTIEYNNSNNQFGIPDTVIVIIKADEIPTSNQPSDITSLISSSEVILWKLYDDFGEGQYQIWANDTNGNYYIWLNWTTWTNNTYLFIPINRTAPGIFNYTIEYYDDQNQFGISDSVIVTITDIIPTPTKDEPIIIAPQGGGDISSFLLSPLTLGIIAGFGAILLILVAVVITVKKNNKIIEELNKKISKTPTSKKGIKK